MHKTLVIFAAWLMLTLVAGCDQISSSDESIRDNRAATTTANVSSDLSSRTLNPTFITEAFDVQAAMEAWMADTDEWPSELVEPTDDLASTEPALSPTYIDVVLTKCKYTWDAQGNTKQHCWPR